MEIFSTACAIFINIKEDTIGWIMQLIVSFFISLIAKIIQEGFTALNIELLKIQS